MTPTCVIQDDWTGSTLEQANDSFSMTKREYNRRTDDELLEDLESQLESLKSRAEKEQRPDAAVLKEFAKVKKTLARFTQICVNNGRMDLSNSTMAFMHTLDQQAKALPQSLRPKSAGDLPS